MYNPHYQGLCSMHCDIWHSWTIPSQDWAAVYKSFSEEGNTETVVCFPSHFTRDIVIQYLISV